MGNCTYFCPNYTFNGKHLHHNYLHYEFNGDFTYDKKSDYVHFINGTKIDRYGTYESGTWRNNLLHGDDCKYKKGTESVLSGRFENGVFIHGYRSLDVRKHLYWLGNADFTGEMQLVKMKQVDGRLVPIKWLPIDLHKVESD
jgi:hypothetical protein